MRRFKHFGIVGLILAHATLSYGLDREYCVNVLGTTLRSFVLDDELDLVPGREVDFQKYSFFAGQTRLEDVQLRLSSNDDLPKLAALFAEGRDPNPIMVRLQTSLAAHTLLSLRDVAPRVVKEKTNTFAERDGPNCWNATLAWDFPNYPIQRTSRDEMEDFLKKEYEKLRAGTRLQWGDVVVIRAGGDLIHTGRYLTRNLIWHKPSLSMIDPYTYETLSGAVANALVDVPNRDVKIEFYRKLR